MASRTEDQTWLLFIENVQRQRTRRDGLIPIGLLLARPCDDQHVYGERHEPRVLLWPPILTRDERAGLLRLAADREEKR